MSGGKRIDDTDQCITINVLIPAIIPEVCMECELLHIPEHNSLYIWVYISKFNSSVYKGYKNYMSFEEP